jgi:integrase
MRKNKDFSKGPVYDAHVERWVVQVFYPNGKRLRKKFRREKLAQRFWGNELQRLEDGTWSAANRPRLSLGEAIKKYRAFSKKHHRSYGTFVEPNLAFWQKQLGKDTPIARVTAADVEDVKLKRADDVAQSTVDRSLQVLKAFFNWLISHDLAVANPVRRVRMFHSNNEVVRYLTRDQYDALLKAADDGPVYLKSLIILAVHTALRRGNLLRLRWKQVDLDARKIRVSDLTKSNKTLEVPINDAAKSALEGMRKLALKNNDYVFAVEKSHITDVKNPFATALKRAKAQLIESEKKDAAAGLDGFRFHDLRHTAASWLAMGGAGLPAIQKFLGHASIKMTLRYAHLSPDFLGQEAKILDRMLPAQGSQAASSDQATTAESRASSEDRA